MKPYINWHMIKGRNRKKFLSSQAEIDKIIATIFPNTIPTDSLSSNNSIDDFQYYAGFGLLSTKLVSCVFGYMRITVCLQLTDKH